MLFPALYSVTLRRAPPVGVDRQAEPRLLWDWYREPQEGTSLPCTQTHAGPYLYSSLWSSVQQASHHSPIQGSYQRLTIHTSFRPGGCCAHSYQCNWCIAHTSLGRTMNACNFFPKAAPTSDPARARQSSSAGRSGVCPYTAAGNFLSLRLSLSGLF